MKQKLPILKLIWNCGCGACHCLNFLLALVALHLTAWILLDSMEKVIPLPDILTDWVVQRTLGPDYSANWSKAVFDLQGGLYLENVKVMNQSSGEILMTADRTRINLAVFHILTGRFPPAEELEAGHVSIYLPAGYAPSGLNEAALNIRNLFLVEDNGSLVIHDLQLQSGGIQMVLSGKGTLDRPADTQQASRKGNPLLRVYDSIGRLQRFSPDFKAILNVDWSRPVGGDHQFKIQFILPSLDSSLASFQRLNGFASLAYSNARVRYYRMEMHGQLSSISNSIQSKLPGKDPFPDSIAFQLSATGKPISVGAVPLPSDLELVFSSPGAPFHFLEFASLETSLDEEIPVIRGTFKGPHLFAKASATPANPSESSLASILHNPIRAEVSSWLDNATLAYFYPSFPKVRLLKGTNSRTSRIQAAFLSEPFQIEGSLLADALHIGATDFHNLQTDFAIDRQHFSLSNAHVQISSLESASGAYHQQFSSSRFALYAKGSIFPAALDSLLGKWWIEIFSQIRVDQPAHGDVSVWGQWRDPKGIESITDAFGERGYYRNYPIPRMKVRVRSDRDWVQLTRLEGLFDEGRVLGQINWRRPQSDEEQRPMLLDFESDGPWKAVVAASGVSYLEQFSLEGNPHVEARGIIWNPSRANRSLDPIPELDIRLNAPGLTLDTGKLFLSNLSLLGHVRGDSLELETVSGGFAGGIFTGAFSLANWANAAKRSRHVKLVLFDADYREAVHQLTGLLKKPEGIRKALLRDSTQGKADADFDLHLFEDVIQSQGTGRVSLRKADIGQIHILGGLSRALSGMGLGFSSLDLNSAAMEWKLENGLFTIPQCLLSGPVLNLSVNGDIDLLQQQIALQANVMLFRGLVGQVFAPVGDTFQFDLSGPLENPAWQVRLNPLRWFTNRLGPLTKPPTP